MLFGLSNTRVSPDAFSQDLLSKVFNEENESIGRHPVSRVVQRTLGTYAALSVGVDSTSRVIDQVVWNSRGMYMDLSRGMKVNEFADLTISEFVPEYPEENPNIVWSGRKHLETHEYINEPLDQVKPDSCFQSSDGSSPC